MAYAMCCCYSLSNLVGEPLQPIPLGHWEDPTNACQYGKREYTFELLFGTVLPLLHSAMDSQAFDSTFLPAVVW